MTSTEGTIAVWFTLLVEDKLLDAEQSDQLCKEVILSEQALGLVRIKRLEVLLCDVGLIAALLYVILLKHRKLDQVRVRDVVQNSVTQNLHLLIATGKAERLFEAAMSQRLK